MLPFTLENDESEYEIGSIVRRIGASIDLTSRNLTETERNYSKIEKELLIAISSLLAIINGLHKCYHYTCM